MSFTSSNKPRPLGVMSQGRRRRARLAAVQALYQMEIAGATAATIVAEFRRHRLGGEVEGVPMDEVDVDFFAELVTGAGGRRAEIDEAIASVLTPDWRIERLEAVLRAILRAGVHELMACRDLPPKVTISEYVAVADAFFSGREPAMVNGVLDRLARHFRPGETEADADGGHAAPR